MNKLYFMHYRNYDRMGQILPKGGLTVAIRQNGNELDVALAECSRKDLFQRKLGRTIAEGRLNAGCVTKLALPPETAVKSFVDNQDMIQKRLEEEKGCLPLLPC